MTLTEGINPSSGDPFANYAADGQRFDEMIDQNGAVREHWKAFTQRFSSFRVTEQVSRYKKLRRLVRENGIAQDLFAEAHTVDEPWKIDAMPLILSAQEWRFLEQAVAENNTAARRLSQAALARLANHTYPGNVRELRNLIERLAILTAGETIDAADMARSHGERFALFQTIRGATDPHGKFTNPFIERVLGPVQPC